MPRNQAGDHREVEPTSEPIPGASTDSEPLAPVPPQRPGPQQKWLKPMRPDNPHRLRPGQTVSSAAYPTRARQRAATQTPIESGLQGA
jgi:hypothetical protein